MDLDEIYQLQERANFSDMNISPDGYLTGNIALDGDNSNYALVYRISSDNTGPGWTLVSMTPDASPLLCRNTEFIEARCREAVSGYYQCEHCGNRIVSGFPFNVLRCPCGQEVYRERYILTPTGNPFATAPDDK